LVTENFDFFVHLWFKFHIGHFVVFPVVLSWI
jgi:hypothetical protein